MKNRIIFLSMFVIFAIVFCLTGCNLFDDSVPKEEIFDYVKENHEALNAFPYEEMTSSSLNEKDFIKQKLGKNTIVKEVTYHDGVLSFYCGGTGISASRSTYCGFYYSQNDTPICKGVAFIETSPNIFEGTTGSWYVRHEKIMDCWYYYYEEYK